MKYAFKHKYLEIFGLKLKNMSNFRPLEVVGRGSETQSQVGENLNYLIKHFKMEAACGNRQYLNDFKTLKLLGSILPPMRECHLVT